MITVTELSSQGEGGADAQQAAKKPSGRRRKKVLLVLAVVLLAVGAWFLLLRGGGGEAEPKPGAMLPLESTQINLAGGHYLKIGVALQLVEGAEEVDGSKALDATIDLFSGREVTELTRTETRQTLKHKLAAELEERYEGDVMEVYFTEFVTQ
jgi:flagellar protein FliL